MTYFADWTDTDKHGQTGEIRTRDEACNSWTDTDKHGRTGGAVQIYGRGEHHIGESDFHGCAESVIRGSHYAAFFRLHDNFPLRVLLPLLIVCGFCVAEGV